MEDVLTLSFNLACEIPILIWNLKKILHSGKALLLLLLKGVFLGIQISCKQYQWLHFLFDLLITTPAEIHQLYDKKKKSSLIVRPRCHGNSVILFLLEDSLLLYLFLHRSKAPLDVNKAAQFISTTLTLLQAFFKQFSTKNLQE